jgi:hypothetical protein
MSARSSNVNKRTLMTHHLSLAIVIASISFSTCLAGEEIVSKKENSKPLPQQNMVFLCKDHGQEIYTNTKLNKGCKAYSLSSSIQSGQKPGVVPSPASATTASPSNFPKVTQEKQKERDTDRKRILEDELSAEQKKLAEAKKEFGKQEQKVLAEEKNYRVITERLQPSKELITQHERNIQALQKELSSMK